ncbi:MAG: ComF family protein [Candidatus Improbicoccus devescovinae]|nr:MAG: ComF family protein [Candidatus Improbicoccus devescovinae]
MNIFKIILNILFPEQCSCCKTFGVKLCSVCARKLQQEFFPAKYSMPSGTLNREIELVSAFIYRDTAAVLIKNFKFANFRTCSQILASFIKRALEIYTNLNFDIITFVPMHNIKKQNLGRDHAEDIAKALSKELKIPIANVLVKNKNNLVQKRLSLVDRTLNVKNAFETVLDVSDLNIALVDDICTTGITLTECAQQILNMGALNVTCVSFAKVLKI